MLGQETGTITGRSVLGQETTHPFHGGHRRHNHRGGVCSVRRLPIHFMVGTGGTIGMGTGGTIGMRAQAAQSDGSFDRTGVLAEYGF